MHTLAAGGKTLSIFPASAPDAPVIYLNTFDGEGQKVFDALTAAGCPPLTLVAISDLNWDHDMVPWDSPAVFKNAAPFTGGADSYLQLLIGEILPAAERDVIGIPRWRGIAGYSLAGLFAVYTLYQTDVFSRAASMSGSLWFPGFKEYVFSHELKRRPDGVFFSLGDRENRTRNPALQRVRQDTQEIQKFYESQGIHTAFHLHSGNHYDRTAQRSADGILWLAKFL